MKVFSCKPISDGLAMGYALDCTYHHKIEKLNSGDIINEVTKFNEALSKSIKDLNDFRMRIDLSNTKILNFIDSHIAMLQDKVFYSEVIEYLKNEKCNIEYSIMKCTNKYLEQIDNLSDESMKERKVDVLDIRERILHNLMQNHIKNKPKRSTILFVDELLPSRILNISPNVRGIIALRGGQTSHSAILCKALGITYVVCDDIEIENNDSVIIDPKMRKVFINPDENTITEYDYLYFDRDINFSVVNKNKDFKVRANVSSNIEIKKVSLNRLDGVGLYRTEFLFMSKGNIYDILEQKNIYEEASRLIYPNPVIIRTFDFGDDKNLPYLVLESKGASNYFKYLDLFLNQVRAIVEANSLGNLRIMFPMIENIDEFLQLKKMVMDVCKEANKSISVGMMLETKNALEHIEDFKDVPFMSIGTNDLMSEIYHINRTPIINYDLYIDDLVERIKGVVDFANKYNIELSLCGEIGSYEKYLSKLIDIGLRSFSCNMQAIPSVIETINKKTIK